MLEESKKKQLAMLAEPVAPPLLLPPKILDVDDKVQPEREILEELEAQKGVERKVTAEKLMKEMKIAGREYEEALNSRPPAKKADDEPEQEEEAGQAKEEKEGEKVGQGQNQVRAPSCRPV
eukprot:763661-Hanusia_phi.AAC.4